MADDSSADFDLLISREQAENAFRQALNLFVGRGKRYSVAQLAKGSGVNPRAIDCFRSHPLGHPDYRRLNFGQVLSIARFLGAGFTTEWLRLADQGAFDLPDEEPDPGALAIETSADSAKVVSIAIDGKVEGHERQDARAVGARMMSRGAQLVAMGR